MTDPGFADRTYLEPLDAEGVDRRPRARAAGRAAADAGRPDRAQPRAGARRGRRPRRARRRADRRRLRRDPPRRGPRALPRDDRVASACACPSRRSSRRPTSCREALALPAVLRPAFTLGGHGGGFAGRREELARQVERGLDESPIGQVLVEESLVGWDEFELEVMRDAHDNVVVVCSIENLDPMGVHTGDSVTVAPQMTLPDEAYQELRDAAARGHPRGRRRDRRLQHPVRARARDRRAARDRDEPARLALVGARVEGDRLPDREGGGEARGRLHARRDPERPDRERRRRASSRRSTTSSSSSRASPSRSSPAPTTTLGTQMKSVGEAMGIGRTFTEAFLKAMRSRELDPGRRRRGRRSTTSPTGSIPGSAPSSSARGDAALRTRSDARGSRRGATGSR